MPCYDGLYTITDIDKEHSTVTLDLPNSPNVFPVFHMSEILPYAESDSFPLITSTLPSPGYSIWNPWNGGWRLMDSMEWLMEFPDGFHTV